MSDDHETRLLGRADQLRTDIANLECGQELLIQRRPGCPREPTWHVSRLGIIFCTVTLTLLGIAAFWPQGL